MTGPGTSEGDVPTPTLFKRALSFLRQLWRRVENFVFVLVSLLILLYFLLQSPAVQNWVIGKITNYLSTEWKTKVSIQHVDIAFFDNLVLDGFYIEDQKGDTLLYAEKLVAGLNSNFFSLLRNRLEFNEITLTHARLNIRRVTGEYDNNLQFLLNVFKSEKPPNKERKAFTIRVQNLRLNDVAVLKDDQVRGQSLFFRVPSAAFRIKIFDLKTNVIDVLSAKLDGVVFESKEYPSQPLPAPERPVAKVITQQIDSVFVAVPKTPLRLNIADFELLNGHFSLDKFHVSPKKMTRPEVMDYNHIKADNIDFQATDVSFDEHLTFSCILRNLSAREQSGFQLDHSHANKVVINDTIAALYDAKIRTAGGASLGDTIMLHYNTYSDFRKFNSKVRMDFRLSPGSKIRLGDVAYFSEKIADNAFFIKNAETMADITGLVEGRVNRLNGRKLDIRVGSGTIIQGDFDGNDMNEGNDRLQMLFRFSRLQSDIETIGRIIPGFNPPKAFYKLGHIGFRGEYSILFGYDHILNGYLITDIGSGKLDMKLNLANGREKASYSGRLEMNNFDLANWTGSKDFGKTTFNISIAEGSTGLTLPTIRAKLSGVVDTFYYRGYNYRNVQMNGVFKENIFDGKLEIKDPNIDFTFDGTLNMKDSIPQFLFQADLRRLDLGALNLLDQDWVLSGKVERMSLRARSINDLTGSVMLRDFRILQDGQYVHRIDSFGLISLINERGENRLNIVSDIANGYLQGRFQLAKVFPHLAQLFGRYHPEFAEKLGLKPPDSMVLTDRYEMELQIEDTRALTRLFTKDLDTLRHVSARASVDGPNGIINAALFAPQLKYKGITTRNLSLNLSLEKETGQYSFILPSTQISAKTRLDSISLNGWLSRDELGIKLLSKDNTNRNAYFVEGINLDAVLSMADSLWQLRFNSSKVALFNEEWLINQDNYVRFGEGFLATKDFEFFSENRRILLDSFNQGRGISFSLTNFDLNYINRFLNPKKAVCRGKIYDLDVQVRDIFKFQGISAFVATDTVFINQIPYGEVTGNLDMEHANAPLAWKMFLNYQQQKLRVAGAWLPGGQVAVTVPDVDVTVKPGEFQTNVNAVNFPLSIIETFIPGISKTSGKMDADARLGGTFSRIGMNGAVNIREGQLQIDYLKAMYHLHNQKITLSEYKIWADGDTIWDASEKNMALVQGGIRHDHFKRWQIDCTIESTNNNFMILNTLPEDNALYYGQGIGYFKAAFSGSFNQTNIVIDAITGKESRLYIPLSSTTDLKEVTFITFRDKKMPRDSVQSKTKNFVSRELKGLNLEMNLTVTEAAEVQLIFDEQTGDIIKGRGEGNIKLVINRDGEFKMYGDYNIRRGEYLFTLLNFVNKPFTVAEGGTINWYGDPYGAQISLDATYSENASLYNLIRDEIQLTQQSDPNMEADARKATKVVVTMHLKGDLLKPAISFDLEIPNVAGQIKTLTDNKLRLLRQDQNELNRQVFGLIVVGTFLPSNTNQFLQNSDYVASAFNTLTQVLSNQFSGYLSELATQLFGGAVSSIDFDIAYNEYQNSLSDPGQSSIGRDLQVRLTSGFANDRLTVQIGSQFGLGKPGVATQDGFLGEDVTVEIQLTENRQWRLKVYQRTEPDIIVGQRRARYGLGISFRKEFDTFGELMGGLSDWFKKK